ncbi:DNA cytosine methyltransferase [Deinococcus rufus]|uniref:Cytosine-specific methyltransferase n=1 Tax=Deinococcus rufus TaxID=2136097 RepID=A0ABV7ZB08_9DEIO
MTSSGQISQAEPERPPAPRSAALRRPHPYPALLAQAWHDAHRPPAPEAPTVISTFAGRGGSTTGYRMAGYRELLAVEWDAHAAETLRLNHPELDVYHGDIAALSVDEALRRTGLDVGELDLLDGSPPCQGFSLMGNRQLDDPRNGLFREYVRLLDGLQPRAFVMENVTGMGRGIMRGVYAEVLEALRGAGPGYRTISGILNAAAFGVPQLRERLIVIGLRTDLERDPTLPAPETRTPITVRQALADLETGPDGYQISAKYLPVFSRIAPGQDYADLHPKNHLFSNRKIHPDRASFTVVKTVGVSRDGHANTGLYHWRWPRLMTIPELKRLGSFPDAYRFAESGDAVRDFTLAWAGIGNSVPPLMARGIARHVRTLLA